MEPDPDPEITDLLTELRNGRNEVIDRLFPRVYDELRKIAHRTLRPGHPDNTLGTTALVHEVYLKLVDQQRAEWRDRAHFYAVAAMATRQILVDYARAHLAVKRGGTRRKVSLDQINLPVEDQAAGLLELDEALTRLAQLDQRLARVVECRFFGGLNEEETAAVLGITSRTVRRDWVKARGLLYREMSG